MAVNKAGDTPLSSACYRGDLEMVKALINKHVDLNSKCLSVLLCCLWWSSTEPVNKAGDTPLTRAYKRGRWKVIKYLAITHHCDTKSKCNLFSSFLTCWFYCILYLVFIYSHVVKIMKVLIVVGLDIIIVCEFFSYSFTNNYYCKLIKYHNFR